ncbi:hypothetical protein HDE_03482 [Halotydeus destructor]|nr:hypothetical protein HDE_03482 [Halotydeus destructor]
MRIETVARVFTRVRGSVANVHSNAQLNRPIDKKDHVNFDKTLYHFAMLADKMENLKMFTGRTKELNFRKKFNNAMVWTILFAYFCRTVACLFINNKRVLMYLGDISPYMGGPRIMYLVPVIGWSFYALALNTLFTFNQRATDWVYPFGVLKGLITPAEAGLQDGDQLKKLVFRVKLTAKAVDGMILPAAIFAGLLFMTIPFYKYENRRDAYLYGLPWGLIQSIWTYYCAGNICGIFGYFHDLCYYLSLRFKKLNGRINYLSLNRYEVAEMKMSKAIIKLVNEHNEISSDVKRFNVFWSKYAAINYFTFIPLECFIMYIAMFADIDFMIWMTFTSLAVNCGAILGIVVLSGAMVAFQAHKCYTDTCSLALVPMGSTVKFKLLGLLFKLGSDKIGFGCLDLFIMTNETFYNMVIATGSFFLLIVDFLQQKKSD